MVVVFLGVIEIEIAEVLLATSGLIFVLIAEIFSQIQLNMFFLSTYPKSEAYLDWYFL